jgi:hypothetical protein
MLIATLSASTALAVEFFDEADCQLVDEPVGAAAAAFMVLPAPEKPSL